MESIHNIVEGEGVELSVGNTPCFNYGEHVVCAWTEDVGDKSLWHLGVVDKLDDGNLYVSYMKRDRNGKNWFIPEEPEIHLIHLIHLDQIIARNI